MNLILQMLFIASIGISFSQTSMTNSVKGFKISEVSFETLNLYDSLSVGIKEGKIKYYKFKPNYEAYYSVETFGQNVTQLCIEFPNGSRVYDSGLEKNDINAKISFKGVKDLTYKIFLKMTDVADETASIGYCSLSLREQTFNSFTFARGSYNSSGIESYDLDTTSDDNTPYSLFREKMYYRNFINKDTTIFNNFNDVLRLFNSEYVMFSGHGDEYSVLFAYHTSLGKTEYLDMRQTKVVFLNACKTAKQLEGEECFAEYTINKGAKCSIGFQTNVDNASARRFGNNFYTKFSTGATVKESIQYAKNKAIPLIDNCVQSVKIYGNENLRITDSTTSNGYFEIPDFNFPLNPGVISYK